MDRINTGRPHSPNLPSTSPQQRVLPGPTKFPHHHSCFAAWPREIPPWILPPLFIRWVTMSLDLFSLSFDLRGLHPMTMNLLACVLHFCFEEGGDSDVGAMPPTPRHCSTRGRVALPPILSLLPHQLHSSPAWQWVTLAEPTYTTPKVIKALLDFCKGSLRQI